METLFGSLFIGLPILLVGLFLFWSNYRPVFWMLAGALILGLGYMGVMGTTYEIGKPIADAIFEDTPADVTPAATRSAPPASGTDAGTVSSPTGRYVTQ